MLTVSKPATGSRSDPAEKAKCLSDTIDRSIARVRDRRNRNKKWAASLRLLTLAGSVVVTVLLGLDVSNQKALTLKQAAFVIGAVLTLLHALEPMFNFRALWVEQDQALAELYQLRTDVDYFVAGVTLAATDLEALERFHARQADIWTRLSTTWVQLRRAGGDEEVRQSAKVDQESRT